MSCAAVRPAGAAARSPPFASVTPPRKVLQRPAPTALLPRVGVAFRGAVVSTRRHASSASAAAFKESENASTAAHWTDLYAPGRTRAVLETNDLLQRLLARAGQLAAAACLAFALVFSSPGVAEAAKSSGRVGGSSFGHGAAVSSSYASPANPGFSGRTYTSSSTVIVAPAPSYGWGMGSFLMPSYGYGMGYGVVGGGPSIFSLLFMALAAFVVFGAAVALLRRGDDVDVDSGACSVVKVQVGLLGLARDLQKDLDRIASRADTSSPEGLQYVLQETVLALLRNPDYCVYGFSETNKAEGLDDAERVFNQLSLAERGKFKGETLSNYAGNSRQVAPSGRASEMSNELIVVTLVMACTGRMKIPQVTNLQELKDSLSKLGSVSADGLLAVEVLWTPQAEGDTFTQEELITDYPMMNAL